MNTYRPTIGIEVHAELKTHTKMFCNSRNDPHAAKPNINICPVCMAHPGTLPVINKKAVEHVVKVGRAVRGEIASYTEFDRKNYFYPDIPKGYQISQYLYPLVKGGKLGGVALTRIHLEEDTARSLHDQGEGSVIDFNRAGVPLMELVTEPVIHDAETAKNFAKELQLLLKTLQVSDANMEKGEMRVEANISVSKTETFGTKVEVKNLNSFKAVENAILYEIKRQTELLEKGKSVDQETRGWDESKGKTFSQRKKETAQEYRYFPDPDIPKFNIAKIPQILDSRLPELPSEKIVKYSNLGLPREQIEILISKLDVNTFFEKCLSVSKDIKVVRLVANYLLTDILPHLKSAQSLESASPLMFVKLMEMVHDKSINSRIAKDLLNEVVFNQQDPFILANSRNLLNDSSADSLLVIIAQIVKDNPSAVLEYQCGKLSTIQYLVGQGMRLTNGSANPLILKELIEKELNK